MLFVVLNNAKTPLASHLFDAGSKKGAKTEPLGKHNPDNYVAKIEVSTLLFSKPLLEAEAYGDFGRLTKIHNS